MSYYTTQNLQKCNGVIGSDWYCTRCGGESVSLYVRCMRLIPVDTPLPKAVLQKETQRALDIAKEAFFLIRASEPAFNARTTYRVINHERFGELVREFFEIEDWIRQTHNTK